MSELKSFVRKSFQVWAIQITAENMEEVAEWCRGTVRQADEVEWTDKKVEGPFIQLEGEGKKYIGVVGSWVIRKGCSGYRIFSDQLFRKTFEPDKTKETRNKIMALVAQAISEGRYETKISGSARITSETTDRIMKLIREEQA